MIIYLDVLFIREYIINFIIIYCTNIILNTKFHVYKACMGGIIGASYTIICLVFPVEILIHAKAICIGLIVLLTCSCKTIENFFKASIIFYMTTFFIAGLNLYTYNQTLKTSIYILGVVILLVELIKDYKTKYRISNYIKEIEIVLNKKVRCKALIDTGHNLISDKGENVIVLSKKIIKKFKDNDVYQILLSGKMTSENKYKCLIRYIPFISLGNPNGVKLGITCKSHIINYKMQSAVIVASEKDFNGYDAIVGLNYINEKGGKNNGNLNDDETKSKKVICKVPNTYRD